MDAMGVGAMGKKHLKFVSITEAITEIKNNLLMQSELTDC
jgi:hypothetical protein